MITPHLPPDQAANALLPRQLGGELSSRGVRTLYVAHPAQAPIADREDVFYVPRRGRDRLARSAAGAVLAGGRMALGAREAVRSSDVVHLHGNGFIIEVGQLLARRYRKPYVITMYGTDVWHHDPIRHARFARVADGAVCRVFYSQGLLDFAKGLGLARDPSRVIYAPVPAAFHPVGASERSAIRRDLGVGAGPVILTVKRLHDVAGYDVWLEAVPAVLRVHPDARIWIAGEGELRGKLEQQTRALDISPQVRFLGMLDNAALARYYAAADLFVLPSRLESWGTVMLEALASGTPVVATDTVGAIEVRKHFPDDLTLTVREDPAALAAAVSTFLSGPRRTSDRALRRLQTEFSVSACATQYLDVYRQASDAV